MDQRASTCHLVASGDLRPAANRLCWPAQRSMEDALTRAFAAEGVALVRAHDVDEVAGHGFIDGQRRGTEVFANIPRDAPVVVAEAVWQYSHHVLAGLRRHRGPILTVANWSGTWPGLVGLLNLNGSLTKAGVAYATLWSEDFQDDAFRRGLRQWLRDGRVDHDVSHVRPLDPAALSESDRAVGASIASELRERIAILGVFDEGCMGMYNAIVDDELLNPLGIYKERLSQSALYAEMRDVPDAEAAEAFAWLTARGMRFEFGDDPATDLTRDQVLEQLKMYVAALRIADRFGCDAIGIQYQQGLKDLTPASDLVEGLLN
ncbi:MAG: fucose isomerase, partial [Trueperaceae bacterium]